MRKTSYEIRYYDQVVEVCSRRPRPALKVRTSDDAEDENPSLAKSIENGHKPAKLSGLFRYLPTYVRRSFGPPRCWSAEAHVRPSSFTRKYPGLTIRFEEGYGYLLVDTTRGELPALAAPKHIYDPNDDVFDPNEEISQP
jgi:hypothetical protein